MSLLAASRPFLANLDVRIVGLTLLTKVVVLAFGAVVLAVLGGIVEPYPLGGVSADPRSLFEPWVRWDAVPYLEIAASGYSGALIVFFPLYPLLIRIADAVLGQPALASILVTGVASLLVGPILYRLVAADEDALVARRSVWFLLILPTAYFLHIGYTEALFLVLALGSLLAARRDRWWLAGVLGALAALTRINGLLLVPALMTEALLQWWPTRGPVRWRWLAIGMVPLGFLGYLALNQAVYGNPLAFLPLQAELWGRTISPPWVGIATLFDPSNRAETAWIPELAFVALAVVGVVVSALRFRPTWTVWMAANLILFTSTSVVTSVPRFSLLFFPLFVWFAQQSRHRPVAVVLTFGSLAGLVFLTGRFALGQWAF
jgi:Mannosyltransferase (PIG-V)